MLADPYRLEGEGAVAWQRPPVGELVHAGLATPAGGVDNRRIERLAGELERGLRPAQSAFAQWCLQKLFVLPTQNGTGLSAALMADNFIDACGHYADDLWQSTTLELLKSATFRPSPAQFVALAEPRHAERARMLARLKTLAAPAPDTARPFVAEPAVVRLRSMRDSYRKHGYAARAATVEIELAAVEGRAPEDWVRAAAEVSNESEKRDTLPTRPPSPQMRAALDAALAAKHRAAGRTDYADQLDRHADALGYYRPLQREPEEAAA